MDVIRLLNPTAPLKMEQGIVINGLTSKMWVERYGSAGEFTFVADASSDLRSLLPIGSFVSHIETPEIMIVENHEIQDQAGQPAQITITGRGFETLLENRMIGSNNTFPISSGIGDYALAADYSYNQLIALIMNHINAASLHDVNDQLPYIGIMTDLSGAIGQSIARSVRIGSLYQGVLDLLAIDNLGIKVVRAGTWSPIVNNSNGSTAVVIHKGQDLTKSIIFSHDTGEITSADYLWSNKNTKNAALVTGRWVATTVVPAATQYARRWMLVDASDIDNNLAAAPTGTALTDIVTSMQQRGAAALAAQVDVALTKADVSPNAVNTAYRKDFNVGDLITVLGSYNESSIMRISEYVEMEDQTGASSYPTLTVV